MLLSMLSDGEFITGLTLVAGAGTELIKLLYSRKAALIGATGPWGLVLHIHSFIYASLAYRLSLHARFHPPIYSSFHSPTHSSVH